jgi:hypothetical protein
MSRGNQIAGEIFRLPPVGRAEDETECGGERHNLNLVVDIFHDLSQPRRERLADAF